MRWVEVVEVETGPAVALAGAVDMVQAGWAATTSALAAGAASRIRWAYPATRKSVLNAAHR